MENKLGDKVQLHPFHQSEPLISYIENDYVLDSPEDILNDFYSNNKSLQNIEQTLKDLSRSPAILIIDHHLRDEKTNGIDIIQKIRPYFPHIFVILLTAEVEAHTAISLHNHDNIDIFVPKNGILAMEQIILYITEHITKIHSQFNYNFEDAFGFKTQLEDKMYISQREKLLDSLSHKAYLTLSSHGDIALLDFNDKMHVYNYHNKAFSQYG